VVIIGIDLAGGRDSLNLFNTTVADGIQVQMGGGHDIANVSNLHCGLFSLSLGGGNVASISNVTALAGGFGVVSNNGNNVIALNDVSTGGNLLEAELSGKSNTVAVVNCVADRGLFSDSGADGVLSGVGNAFQQQTVDTFQFRFGDLKNDEA
jgi:hypothetical protein